MSRFLSAGGGGGVHAPDHSDGGADEVTVENLATASVDTSNVVKPDGSGGLNTGDLTHAELGTVTSDQHHAQAHAAAHADGGADDLTAQDIAVTDLKISGEAHFGTEVDNGNSGAADTINWTDGNKQKSTLTDNVTFTFTEPTGACSLILKLIQDAMGGRTVTWPADVKWPGGVAPTLSSGANEVDIVSFYYDGADFYGVANFNFS